MSKLLHNDFDIFACKICQAQMYDTPLFENGNGLHFYLKRLKILCTILFRIHWHFAGYAKHFAAFIYSQVLILNAEQQILQKSYNNTMIYINHWTI